MLTKFSNPDFNVKFGMFNFHFRSLKNQSTFYNEHFACLAGKAGTGHLPDITN
jgi:hypothetical protein